MTEHVTLADNLRRSDILTWEDTTETVVSVERNSDGDLVIVREGLPDIVTHPDTPVLVWR